MTTGKTASARVRLRDHTSAIRSLLAGSLITLTGTEVFEIVVLMLTTVAYGALLSTGVLGVAMRLAPMVLSPVITAALDRTPARRAQFARATVLARAVAIGAFAVLLAFDAPPVWAAYILIALIAALDASYLSAVRATIPQVLGASEAREAHLSDATSRLVAQWNGVQIIVPPAVFLLLELFGAPSLLALAAGMLLAGFVVLGELARRAIAADSGAAPTGAGSTMWERLTSGFRTVAAEPVARSVAVLGAASQGTLFAFSLAVPVTVAGRAPDVVVGMTLAAMAVGSLVSARWAARFTTRAARLGAMLGAGLLQAVVLAGLAPFVVPGAVGVALVAAGLLLGVAAGVGAVGRGTLLQSEFDAARLGGLVVTVAVLGQVLMPVLPGVWEYVADGQGGIPTAFLLLAGVQVVGLLVAGIGVPRIGRNTSRDSTDEVTR